MLWVPDTTRMVTLAGVKSAKDTGQVPVAEVQVELLVDPSGAVTTTDSGVIPGAAVTSTTRPVQPISVQAVGLTTSQPEPKAAKSTSVIARSSRGVVIEQILAGERRVGAAAFHLNASGACGTV